MPKLLQSHIVKAKFSSSTLRQISNTLEYIDFCLPAEQIIHELDEKADTNLMWALCSNPAYHIQYQIDAYAILHIQQHYLIVWKPKYIEYPTMVQFPDLNPDKKMNNLSIEVEDSNLQAQTQTQTINFISQFYATYFHSDPQFEINLATYAKHFITKRSKICYWHCLYDNHGKLRITYEDAIDAKLKLRIRGAKNGHDKTLLLFSRKGSRDSILPSFRKKWMQIFTFIAMLAIFFSVVSCSSGDQEGICLYRQEIMVSGAGIMMAILGTRVATNAASKKKLKEKMK